MKKFAEKLKVVKFLSLFLVLTVLVGALLLCNASHQTYNKNNTSAVDYVSNDAIDKLIDDYYAESPTASNAYDLSRYYPILAENQTSSNFCWAYASTKVLETSLMLQANEYNNFSETGLALLEYFNDANEIKKFDREGNFESFCSIIQNYGLIHENDFSNDNYFDISNAYKIDSSDLEKYRYVINYSDKLLSEEVLPVCFSFNERYQAMTLNEKELFIKSYIKRSGGIFAGLEAGTFYDDGSVYGNYQKGILTNSAYESVYKQRHAVCIIGWGTKGWLAINSWGVEKQIYEKFYIPYDYAYTYDTFAGFICNENKSIKISESSANTQIKSGMQTISNIFWVNETLSLKFDFDETIDFDALYFNVYHGQADVTNFFDGSFDKSTLSMRLTNSSTFDGKLSGTYLVKFYCGNKYLGAKEIFVYTGTEIAYIEFISNNVSKGTEDTALLLSSHATNDNSATFYVSANSGSSYSYSLKVFCNDISKGNLKIIISDFYLTHVEDGKISRQYVTGNYGISDTTNIESILGSASLMLNFASGTNPVGKMVEFKMSIVSDDIDVPTRDIYVKVIVSDHISGGTTTTDNAVAVEYVLNGGTNNPYNIDRMPRYSIENSMTSFILYPATKGEGYNFLGWYIDPDFKTEFDSDYIDKDIVNSKTLVLYARWSSNKTNYFEGSFGIFNVLDYDQNIKKTSDIIYGDSVVLSYDFKELANLTSENYLIKYVYYVNDKFEFENSISGDGNKQLNCTLKAPMFISGNQTPLIAGNYNVKVVVNVVISRQFSVSDEQTLSFSVSKKDTSVGFEKLQMQYDGTSKLPQNPVFLGVYNEDVKNMTIDLSAALNDNNIELSKVISSGIYKFNVLGLSNKNYNLVGNTVFDFEITKCELSVVWNDLNVVYNGLYRLPIVSAVIKSDGSVPKDPITIMVISEEYTDGEYTSSFKDVGSYNLRATLNESSNYVVAENETNVFNISPARLRVKFINTKDRAQTAPIYRKKIEYEIIGTVYGDDEINLSINCEGLNSLVSGKYPITATYSNSNYNIEFEEGIYTLTGIYSVFYTLPNGEIYEQILDDDVNPTGITPDIYPLPKLSKFSYNAPLVYNGDDLYITVTIINYSWIVWVSLVIVMFVVIYIIVTHKIRKNKIR